MLKMAINTEPKHVADIYSTITTISNLEITYFDNYILQGKEERKASEEDTEPMVHSG